MSGSLPVANAKSVDAAAGPAPASEPANRAPAVITAASRLWLGLCMVCPLVVRVLLWCVSGIGMSHGSAPVGGDALCGEDREQCPVGSRVVAGGVGRGDRE
jgi:hypothetical protein